MRQAAAKPLAPVPGGIGMTKRHLHPDFAVAYLDRTDRCIVRPQVERTAAFEIKSGVVPMTGQDAVVDAPAIEREAHMRATIVERKDASAVVDHQDWTVPAVNNEPSLRPEFCEAPCEREFRCRRIHGRSPVMGPQVLVIAVF